MFSQVGGKACAACRKEQELKELVVPNNITLSYAAGIVDGEGCITLSKCKKKNSKNCLKYKMTVVVSMCNPKVPEFLHNNFGGALNTYKWSGPKSNVRLPIHIWQIHTQMAGWFLKIILPFLLIKKEQAKLAIEYLDNVRREHIGGCKGFSDEFHKYQEEVWLKLKELKKDGGR